MNPMLAPEERTAAVPAWAPSRRSILLAGALACGLGPRHGQAAELAATPAARSAIATQAAVLGMAWAGLRAVAVGDHGIVLLSDDQGARWRQAAAVPVSTLLTSVHFADADHGWAVGHGGAILATTDGGEHWQVQRLALGEDRPLFSVYFFNAQEGVAVGLWSLTLTTQDGGKTWHEQHLPNPPGSTKADANLMQLFAGEAGRLYVAAERGLVLKSVDRGASWSYLSTDFKGSFWCGVALDGDTLLAGGIRGALYRSDDGGRQWQRIPLESTASVTALAAAAGGRVLALGLDGLQAESDDAGRHFAPHARPDRLSLTAALPVPGAPGRWLLGSRAGVLPVAGG